MNAQSVMEEWEPRPFDGGFGGLIDLATEGFSGAVEADDSWLFLQAGEPLEVIVELSDAPRAGRIDAFDGASGTAHEAPHPAAATLAAMLAGDGDIRGQYYTDDTPLSRVHETLTDGGFTGYVELSENVLSGDYYVVYRNGDADHVAFLGSNRLLTDEEAERKAHNEVGIYSVVAVQFPDIEIPEPAPKLDPTSTDSDDEAPGERTEPEDEEAEPGASTEPDDAESEPKPERKPEEGTDSEPERATEPNAEPEPEPEPEPERQKVKGDASPKPSAEHEAATERVVDPDPDDQSPGTEPDDTGIGNVTTHVVPSLDPERSGRADDSDEAKSPSSTNRGQQPSREPAAGRSQSQESDVEAIRERYEERLEALRADLEDVAAERDELREERDELRAEIEQLEAELESLRSTGTVETGASAGRSLSEPEALAGTSLFVRETSRGEATLEDAHDGSADREELAANLRIEHHTQFDDSGATVDGEPFESFLRESLSYRFADWLVTELLFEIRSTGNDSGMRKLYDSLPAIDRVGFRESVTLTEGGGERQFDVVARDRMGEPLIVAELDPTRDPTTSASMEPIVENASDVAEVKPSLAAAVSVTASYFEPDALDTAREATSGSLLSRDKRRSYVKLSRKLGYHLCLVEARDGSFHLTMPEL